MDDREPHFGLRAEFQRFAGEQRSRDDHSFARNMARAEFGRFYWNDALETERRKSLQTSLERVGVARREQAKARAKSKAGQ